MSFLCYLSEDKSEINFKQQSILTCVIQMENTVIGASVIIILASPILGRTINMNFVQNIFVRFALLAFVFYGIRQGAMGGLLSFLAAFSLLIERNHQVLTRFPNQIPQFPTGEKAGVQGPPSYASPLTPVKESHAYEAPHAEPSESVVERHGESTTESLYESAGDIEDSNPRLGEVAQGEAAGSFYEQKGLA